MSVFRFISEVCGPGGLGRSWRAWTISGVKFKHEVQEEALMAIATVAGAERQFVPACAYLTKGATAAA